MSRSGMKYLRYLFFAVLTTGAVWGAFYGLLLLLDVMGDQFGSTGASIAWFFLCSGILAGWWAYCGREPKR